MQVVGSSRISNTTYLAVSSIYWTLFLTITNTTLNLDIQTALLVITPAAGIASLLWVARIEEVFITRMIVSGLLRSPSGTFVRYHLGYSILNMQPWKEAIEFEQVTIEKNLRNELKRVLRSPLLKEEMESIFQLFWLLISIPALFLLLGLASAQSLEFPEVLILLVVFGYLVDVVFLLIMLVRKRPWSSRILGYAFCSWFIDTIRTIFRRRESFSKGMNPQFPLGVPPYFSQRDNDSEVFIERVESWTKELVSLANREDWNGFDRNLEQFLNSQSLLYHQTHRFKIFDSVVSDLIWSYKREKILEPYSEGNATNSFEQIYPFLFRFRTREKILDALSEISYLNSEFVKSKDSWSSKLVFFLEGWVHVKTWSDIYSILSQNLMSELSERVIQAIAELPFFMNDINFNLSKLCSFRGSKHIWLVNAISCLNKAVDRDLIEPLIVFLTATNWGIVPKEYLKECSPHVRPLILEIETDISAIEIRYVVFNVIHDSRNIDVDKVAANLLRYKSDPEYKKMISELERLIASNPGKTYANRAKEILEKMNAN